MDELEFRRFLELFPVVRSRDFHLESETRPSASQSVRNLEGRKLLNEGNGADGDAFWNKLKAVAEQKVGTAEAEKFCKAFQQVYMKLVYEELSSDAAHSFLKS
ncbi:PREDICTED: uncharacterized protein LOC109159699 isoform X2 [Ipomoea nil]|uniref:uncharacterized protein LOC109159699 isoform X2 n=1 Tax=Ipomoea nil TaxID=35883 RepID=UPI000901E9BA|nr:PREDICTED: uncharacterized protein LOC109159699 isoform X2 [Ipomoea nil]